MLIPFVQLMAASIGLSQSMQRTAATPSFAFMSAQKLALVMGGGDGGDGINANVAVQDLLPSRVTGGVAQAPVHPPKVEPLAGVAVGVICVHVVYVPDHVVIT